MPLQKQCRESKYPSLMRPQPGVPMPNPAHGVSSERMGFSAASNGWNTDTHCSDLSTFCLPGEPSDAAISALQCAPYIGDGQVTYAKKILLWLCLYL